MKIKISFPIASMPLWLITFVILSACGSSMKVFTDVDDSGRFDQYLSYDFLEFTEGNKKTINQMELERIRVAFAREFEKKGLKYLDQNGDISVQITVFHREAMDNNYGYRWRYRYMERAISVDIYDNQTKKHVWHCAAVGELVYDPAERADMLPEVAAEIFDRYPVQPDL